MRATTIFALVSLVLLACEPEPSERLPGAPCPSRMAHLPEVSACIDRHEARIDERGRAAPAGGQMPANGVAWATADRACRAAGHRLCTAIEWERACAGTEGRAYPYGEEYDLERCNSVDHETPPSEYRLAASGSHAGCATPEGVYDLSGNVGEWLQDTDASGRLRELRGGSFGSGERWAACVTQPLTYQPPDVEFDGQGFRCCADARDRPTSP